MADYFEGGKSPGIVLNPVEILSATSIDSEFSTMQIIGHANQAGHREQV